MFLDCPAYLDEDGTRRCGLPAEVRCRFVVRSSDGPVEAATIRCPAGHWFNGAIESLTWDREETETSPTARACLIARGTLPDDRGAAIGRDHPGKPRQETARRHTAPAYYLGRPARVWITAMSPRRRPQPAPGAQHPAGNEQTPDPAREPSQALA
jgi:hypothetical protein